MQKHFFYNILEIAKEFLMAKVYASIVIVYTTLTLIMNLLVR